MTAADVHVRRVSDVIQRDRPSLRADPAKIRFTSKTKNNSGSSPGIATHRHEIRREKCLRAIQSVQRPTQQRIGMGSELLPSVCVTSLRHPSWTSPTHDDNNTSSPTSNMSSSLGIGREVGGIEKTKKMTQSSMVAPESLLQGSPVNRSSMSRQANTSETPRLSPVAPSDRLRVRASKRVMNSLNTVIKNVATRGKPRRVEGNEFFRKLAAKRTPHRRMCAQHLPKRSPGEETSSVRRKIQQFRKWQEDQFVDNLQKLKVDSGKDLPQTFPKRPPLSRSLPMDLAKILEENRRSQNDVISKSDIGDSRRTSSSEQHKGKCHDASDDSDDILISRDQSGDTWHTWRDANDSYAYDNVAKYIEENELLPRERVNWILSWLNEVEKGLNYYGGIEKGDAASRKESSRS